MTTLYADDDGYVNLPDGSVFPAGRGHSVRVWPRPSTLVIPDDPEWLSQRLPVHRYCDTNPRGHQSCVDEAARLLAAMRGAA